MNENYYMNSNGKYVYDETLFADLIRYGAILGDFHNEDNRNEQHRVRVFELEGKKYWVHQFNGDVVEFREIT